MRNKFLFLLDFCLGERPWACDEKNTPQKQSGKVGRGVPAEPRAEDYSAAQRGTPRPAI